MSAVLNAEAILAVLSGLTPWHGDRNVPADERMEALRPYAAAFAELARNNEEAALLIAQGEHDSHFALRVVRGHCDEMPKGERCDRLHARGALQIHSWCRLAWSAPAGSAESILEETRCALRIIRDGRARCRDSALTPMHGAYAALAAKPCSWRGADVRVASYRTILARLEKR